MGERTLELKVGAVLLSALLVLGGFVLFLGDVNFQRGTKLKIDYAFSGAIQPGAPVRISGVKVGRVDAIEFLAGTIREGDDPIQVRLVLFVEDRAKPVLREGAQFFVNTQGLLGEHYVEIVPSRHPGELLAEGAIVRGVDPPRFDLLIQRVYDFLGSLSDLLQSDRKVIEELLQSGAELVRGINGTVKDNREVLDRTITNVAEASEQTAVLLKKLNSAVGDGHRIGTTVEDVAATSGLLRRELPEVLAKVQHALTAINHLADAAGGIDRSEVDGMVGRASSALERANQLLGDVQSVSQRVRAGSGTVGLLLQDEEIYDDLKELLKDLKQHPWKLVWKQ